jgi:hydrogenase-4 membrane subunit HyfE
MTSVEKVFYWLPRIASIGFVLFLSVFALDVFTAPFEPVMLVGFLVHLIPSFILLGAVLLAWRYELVGTIMFLGFATLYLWDIGFTRPWSWYAGIVAPAAIVGVLFLLSWFLRRHRKQPTPEQHSSNQ